MEKLALETQTLYAELMERLTALEAQRAIGRTPGWFSEKTVKGGRYYYQYQDPGGTIRQTYVGKKTEDLDRIVAQYNSGREMLRPDLAHIHMLCALLRAGGALVTDAGSARVLKALADSGVFIS